MNSKNKNVYKIEYATLKSNWVSQFLLVRKRGSIKLETACILKRATTCVAIVILLCVKAEQHIAVVVFIFVGKSFATTSSLTLVLVPKDF